MILTACPACAAPLPEVAAKQCSRCKTRYCGAACQKKHWNEGGHDKLCKKIRKGGGAEQYYADKKCADAVAVAAEACAAGTKGQTCYICTETVHRHTKEGLVRGCACHTTEGFVHVSCLAEQAKILVAEAQKNNLHTNDGNAMNARWLRWIICGLCKQEYHGVVKCALGWACWKTYVGRSEDDQARRMSMNLLGAGLFAMFHHADALSVQEAELSMLRRVGASKLTIFGMQSNLASTYARLGRIRQALQMQRDVYSGLLELYGEEHENTLRAATNYAWSLINFRRFEDGKALLRKTMPLARRVLGENHEITLKVCWAYARALYEDSTATLGDLREAVNSLQQVERTARRVFGRLHPTVVQIEHNLRSSQAVLGFREPQSAV